MYNYSMENQCLEKLIELRKSKNYRQEDMAEILDISLSSYVRKENGRTQFLLREIAILIKEFEKSFSCIFSDYMENFE